MQCRMRAACGVDGAERAEDSTEFAREFVQVVGEHKDEIKACIDDTRARGAALPSQLDTKWAVGCEGRVRSIESEALDGPRDVGVEACLRAAMRTWQFPTPPGGRLQRAVFPLLMKRK